MILLDPKLFDFASQIDDNTIEQAKQTFELRQILNVKGT
jgi:hypothetical protein